MGEPPPLRSTAHRDERTDEVCFPDLPGEIDATISAFPENNEGPVAKRLCGRAQCLASHRGIGEISGEVMPA